MRYLHTMVRIADIEQSLAFYCGLLGLEEVRRIENRAGRFTLVKLNTDEHPLTPGSFGVRGLPTLLIFKDGKLLSMKTGAMTKAKLAEWIDQTTAAAG